MIQHKLTKLTLEMQSGQMALGVKQLNESVAGWQRYYGTLVEPAEMSRLAQELQRAVSQKLAQLLAGKKAAAATELQTALERLEIPTARSSEERQAFIQTIIAQAQEAARQQRQQQQTSHKVKKTVRQEKRRRLRRVLPLAHLVINTPGLFLGKQGNRVVVRQQRQVLYEVLFSGLESITLLAQGTSLSSDLITHCASQGIPLCWLSATGEIQAHILGQGSLGAAVQVRQLEATQNPGETMAIARTLVVGKIKNQTNLIKYFGKYEKRRNGSFLEEYAKFLAVAESLLSEAAGISGQGDLPSSGGSCLALKAGWRVITGTW